MSKIYTKKGDNGCTTLYSGEVLCKTHNIFTLLRANDELTSRIGMAVSLCKVAYSSGQISKKLYEYVYPLLETIQKHIQTLNSDIATVSGRYYESTRFRDVENVTKMLEREIDFMTAALPPLKTFILPGGTVLSSQIHLCRTATRESEVAINRSFEVEGQEIEISPENKAFLNRLSDFFFTLARYVNSETDVHFRSRRQFLVITILIIITSVLTLG